MNFIPVTSADDSESTFEMFRERMTKGCEEFQKKLGYPGGYLERAVNWNASEKIWSVFDAKVAERRFWRAFGTQHPQSKSMLDIVVECNPPLEGIDRRCAGAFLRVGKEVFIAHSGKIGGGRRGIGKSAFVDAYLEGNWQPVQWGNHETKMIVVGGLRDRQCRSP